MSVVGATQIPVEIAGGLYTLDGPEDLPPGASPNCADLEFLPGIPGTIKTRPGLAPVHQFAGNPTVNYIRTFRDLQQNTRNLNFNSDQSIWQEFPQGTYTKIGSALQSVFCKSDTAFGREFMAFSDGKFGTDMPLQWDGVNLDRVSQDGPGASPMVVDGGSTTINILSITQSAATLAMTLLDPAGSVPPGLMVLGSVLAVPAELIPGALFTIAGNGSNAAYNSTSNVVSVNYNATTLEYLPNVVTTPDFTPSGTYQSQVATVTTQTAHNLIPGQVVTLAATGVAAYNGAQTVLSVPSPTTFTFNGSAVSLGTAAAGTITAPGNISAGIHQLTVFFVTRQGYFTRAAPPTRWTAAGGQIAIVSGIPTGPPNVVERILAFTVSGGANFFYTTSLSPQVIAFGNMVINDNVTTSEQFDFTDLGLQAGNNVDNQFDVVTLGEVAGFLQYADRLVAWGERNKIQNVLNLSFDGGFSFAGFGNVPFGWFIGAFPGNLGGQPSVNGQVWGGAWQIVGSGVGATRGVIQQPIYNDWELTRILQDNTAYSVRARILIGGGISQGTVHINLTSPSLGAIGTGLSVSVAQATAAGANIAFAEFIQPLCSAQAPFPSDVLLQLYVDGTPTNGGYFIVDDIEIFPTLDPYNSSTLRISLADDPETFIGTTGFSEVNQNDDRRITCCVEMRERLYIAKSVGLFTTQDNGNEPGGSTDQAGTAWQITTVSKTIGTVSINSFGNKQGETGSDWTLLLSNQGLYIFWGSDIVKISQEIQISNGVSSFSWDAINWQYGHTAWLIIDSQERRVLMGLPLGEINRPNVVAMMDFRTLANAEAIAETPLVHMSAYSNKQVVLSSGRKWCPWTIAANCAGLIDRQDGTVHMFLGNNAGNGFIYDLLEGQTTDNGVNIPGYDANSAGGYYQTSYYPGDEQKQTLEFVGKNTFLSMVTARIDGSGNIYWILFGPGDVKTDTIPGIGAPAIPLQSPTQWDLEMYTDFRAERMSFVMSASGPAGSGVTWSAQKVEMFLSVDPCAVVRGFN